MNFDDGLRDARIALKTGQLQTAMDLYNRLLAAQPQDPQLFFERGLVAHLGQAAPLAQADYRTCLALDLSHPKARENLGQIARRSGVTVGDVSLPLTAATDSYIQAVGSSHIRSFSSSTLFLPLWLGPANELSFIDDARAARTTAHLLAAVERCDLRNPVMLQMSDNDTIVLASDILGTKELQAKGELGTDEELVVGGSLRFAAAIETILVRNAGIKLAILGGLITYTPESNRLIRLANGILQEHCDRLGAVLVDCNDELADPDTGLLRAELSSHEGDIHLSKETLFNVMSRVLPRYGLMPRETLPFEWSFLWQAPLSPEFVVRIWGEPHTGPTNLVHSRTVAFNHVLDRALNVMLGTIALHDGPSVPSVLVPYCREGFIPLSLPIGSTSPVTGVDWSAAPIVMARRLANYFRRPEIDFRFAASGETLAAAAEPHDYVLVALRDEEVGDPQRFLDEMLDVCRHSVVILSTLDWSSLRPPSGPWRQIIPIADAVTRPPWNTGTILIERKSR